jgi:6-phosphofructokinase 1
MGKAIGRIGILTGGGDVQPLNAVLHAAALEAEARGLDLIGFVKGWQGLLYKEFVPLSEARIDPSVGGTILKSSRVRIDGQVDLIKKNSRDLGLEGLIVIGGEDTLANCFSVMGLPIAFIPKTIDNDVGVLRERPSENEGLPDMVNYFTLGYPTAAAKLSSFVSLREGLRTTAYSHERLIVVESMGMHAGWLALSSSLGYPDFIIIPEFPLDYERFKSVATERYLQQRHLIVVVAEGANYGGGDFLGADREESDEFGHPRFKGSAEALAKRLKEDLRPSFDTRNINAVNPSYLYRSGTPGALDVQWGRELGRKAVTLLSEGLATASFLALQKEEYTFSLQAIPLSSFQGPEDLHRFVDERFYDPHAYSVTQAGMSYLLSLMDDIPLSSYGLSKPSHT